MSERAENTYTIFLNGHKVAEVLTEYTPRKIVTRRLMGKASDMKDIVFTLEQATGRPVKTSYWRAPKGLFK